MTRRLPILTLFCLATLALPAAAQPRLSLAAAIERARAANVDVRAAAAASREAEQRVKQAQAGYLPRVDVVESWHRGNGPVFAFSSLLNQRQFTAADFALDSLNHPDPVNNFRTALTVDQTIFNAATKQGVRAASIGREAAELTSTLVHQDLAVATTEVYGRVLVAASSATAAAAAIEAAVADRELAGNRRDAGLVTDADVLQLDVHLARMRERQIQAVSDEQIARAQLNQIMGEPLDARFELEPAPEAAGAAAAPDVAALEAEALRLRPDVKLAILQEEAASVSRDAAKAAFWPEVSAQAGWEGNGGEFNSQASNWMVGVVARVNLFRGLADRARVAETRELLGRRAVEREKAETAARLDVRIALARLEAARAAEAAGRAAVEQARESRRIVRDRYETGLTDVASLLRAAEAVQDAETRRISAQVSVLLAAAALDRALGR